MSEIETTKYLVSDTKGEFVMELPTSWKITFSNVNPASAGEGGGFRDKSYCLRVWETKEKLRAVFSNVTGVRDLDIPLARKVDKQTGSATWSKDSIGNFESTESIQIDSEFILEK